MIIKYNNKEYFSNTNNKQIVVNLDELYYIDLFDNYSPKEGLIKLDYKKIKYISDDFSICLTKDRIEHFSVEMDTLDLEWDKKEYHTNILETDDNDGVLELI